MKAFFAFFSLISGNDFSYAVLGQPYLHSTGGVTPLTNLVVVIGFRK